MAFNSFELHICFIVLLCHVSFINSPFLSWQHIAICPFCKTVLKIGVDIYGFDGLYWSEQGKYHQKVNSCDHYVEHDQALHFHNRIPTLEETGMNKRGILIGPEVPYINPILMEQTGIQGIISQVQVAD